MRLLNIDHREHASFDSYFLGRLTIALIGAKTMKIVLETRV